MKYRMVQPDDRSLRLEISPSVSDWVLPGGFAMLSLVICTITLRGITSTNRLQCDRAMNQCVATAADIRWGRRLPSQTWSLHKVVAVERGQTWKRTRNGRRSVSYLRFRLREPNGWESVIALPFDHDIQQIKRYLQNPQQQTLLLVDYLIWQKLLAVFLSLFFSLATACMTGACGQHQQVTLDRDQKNIKIDLHYNWMGHLGNAILFGRVDFSQLYPQLFPWSEIENFQVHRQTKQSRSRKKSQPMLKLHLLNTESPIELLRDQEQQDLAYIAKQFNTFMDK